MPGNPQPLSQNFPIVNSDGTPNDYFIRWAQERQIDITAGITAEQAQQLIVDWSAQRHINTMAPIAGGGALNSDLTISHAVSGVVADTYGDSTHVPQITVDENGHITDVVDVPISGGGGGGFTVLFDTTLVAATANVNIPAISGAYTDLRLIVETAKQGGGTEYFAIRCNGDTGAHYGSYTENRFGTVTYNDRIRFGAMESSPLGFALSDGWIFGYSNPARFKSTQSRGSFVSSSFHDTNDGIWADVSAITTLDVFTGSGNFDVGTRIRLLAT